MSNQLIGIEKLKEAKFNYLSQYASDPVQYNQHLNMFNQVSDYRLFQDMTPAEVAKIKSGMTKAEQDEISKKIKIARQLGVIK
jgi:ribosomal protein S18